MKKDKIIYWVSTSLAMLLGATSAFFYFTSAFMIDGFRHLGFPDYFRIELGIAKIVGLFVILTPGTPRIAREWAYVGFAITFISGAIAHGLVDGMLGLFPLLPLIALMVSYYYFRKVSYSS